MRPSTHRIRRGLLDLAPAIYREHAPLTNLRILPMGVNIAPEEASIPAQDAPGWLPIAPGERWGGQDQNAWFHGDGQVPAAWRERLGDAAYSLALRLLLGESLDFGWPEGLLYVNGALLQGINQYHPDVLMPESALATDTLAFDVRAWSGISPGERQLKYAEVALLNRNVESLYHLLYASLDLVEALEERDPLLQPLVAALEDTYGRLDLRHPEDPALDVSAASALAALRERMAELRSAYDPPHRPRVTAVGHGHLDVAWLWQTRHTREKAARTFSVATALMDLYPEYHYLHTTPQVFDWLSGDYPELFARARRRVAEGRFEVAGAMWLESDTNLVSGESLVRQILYGQRYTRETFGAEYDVLWLPDTFGYTYALPQIMLKSGLRAFMTTKMSWSDTNRIPHDTFRWRGLDGSETLAHFVTTPWLSYNSQDNAISTTDTYNGRLDVLATRKLWERYRTKAVNQDLLLIYGYGDGGAGPTRQHIESYRALAQLPGMPDLQLGRADGYFHCLRERVWNNPALPLWDGELYMEYHRGVYTTQGWLKRLHRRNEERLLLAESLDAQRWALASVAGAQPVDARAALDDAWRTLLQHEFHDILPGSSIGPVYDDARRHLTALAEDLDSFIEQAAGDIAHLAGAPEGAWLIYNPSPFPTPGNRAIATLPIEDAPALALVTADHSLLPSQEIVTLGGERALLLEIPMSAGRDWLAAFPATDSDAAVRREPIAPAATLTADGGAILENADIRVTLDSQGNIVSLLDRRITGGRELIRPGAPANVMTAFDDRPEKFDAWDIDAGYEHKPYAMDSAAIIAIDSGPLRATVRVHRTLLGSAITQDISVFAGHPRIDFATHIDWRERHLLLKVAFPLDLRATEARSEIQFGSIARPTHRNTSWDEARFETVAHRWVDLSETSYGVALLNDGKYGHDIRDATIRLSLLRSPVYPDPNADQGPHDVTYSLLPHPGAWPAGQVIEHGYALNRPPRVFRPASDSARGATPRGRPPHSAPLQPLFRSDTPGVVIEAIKRAAEGEALIVRVYEATGARHVAHISSVLPLAEVIEADLLERPLREGESPAYDLWRASPSASHDEPVVDRELRRGSLANDNDAAVTGGESAPNGSHEPHGWTFTLRPYEIRTFRVTLAQP
jgi:alpha-mannosidase